MLSSWIDFFFYFKSSLVCPFVRAADRAGRVMGTAPAFRTLSWKSQKWLPMSPLVPSWLPACWLSLHLETRHEKIVLLLWFYVPLSHVVFRRENNSCLQTKGSTTLKSFCWNLENPGSSGGLVLCLWDLEDPVSPWTSFLFVSRRGENM